MKKITVKFFNLKIAAFILIIVIAADPNNHHRLSAAPEPDKSIVTEKKTPAVTKKKTSGVKTRKSASVKKSKTLKTPIKNTPETTDLDTAVVEDEKSTAINKTDTSQNASENNPAITDQKIIEVKNEKSEPIKKSDTLQNSTEKTPVITDQKTPVSADIPVEEQTCVKAEDIYDHPEVLLNSYKEAYPELITEVTKVEDDWVVKFKNGNIYYWADGKILPEAILPKSDKYTRYSISPYNMNGRSPELYSEEKIKILRTKNQPDKKKKVIPGVEGGLYKELYGITTKKSAKKQLVEVKLSGHYIKVHRKVADKIKSIDLKIKQLAKTDSEVNAFLKSIGSVQAFNWRNIAGTHRKSNHSYGIAIDILPKKYHKKTLYWLWEQQKNEDWMLLPQSSLWTPPDPVIKIFLAEGFIWGGHWDRYDTMHFEYRPELIALFSKVKFN